MVTPESATKKAAASTARCAKSTAFPVRLASCVPQMHLIPRAYYLFFCSVLKSVPVPDHSAGCAVVPGGGRRRALGAGLELRGGGRL
eukprot:1295527-Rhodomonas_salina.1